MLSETSPASPVALPQTLLSSSAYYACAPWQYIVMSKLHDMERAPAPKRADDIVVSLATVMLARTVVAELPELRVPTPLVCSVSGGDIGMIWSVGSKQLEVIFGADQIGTFILSQGNELLADGEFAGNSVTGLARAINSVVSV